MPGKASTPGEIAKRVQMPDQPPGTDDPAHDPSAHGPPSDRTSSEQAEQEQERQLATGEENPT